MLSVTTLCAFLLGSWSIFHLLHNLLLSSKTIRNFVEHFMQRNHICISLFHIRWFTRKWNKHFIWVGKKCHLTSWFNAGVTFGFVAMLVSIVVLLHMLLQSVKELTMFSKGEKVESSQVLKVIVPGVNLPLDDIAYLLSAVLLAAIFHELGHAVAAIREGVQVNGFGLFLYIIYPGAYVDLNSEDLSKTNPIKQLRIYCAGVWHNFILCVIACILIFGLPWLLLPLYSSDGTLITYQSEMSPLHGEKGLQLGDIVKKVGICSVSNTSSWYSCINNTSNSPQMGSCVSINEIKMLETTKKDWNPNNAASKYHCCDESETQTHLCYSYQTKLKKFFSCLPGRVMMENSDCLTSSDCSSSKTEKRQDRICVTPHLDDLSIRFTRIVVKRGSSNFHVLYYGDPKNLARFVTISDYTPRLSFIPLRLPEIFLRFLQYVFSMSGALALMNIVPCYALDGQWAFKAFLEYFYGKPKNDVYRQRISYTVLTFGTVLLGLNVMFGLAYLFAR